MNKLNQNFRHFSSSEGGGGGTGDGEWLDGGGGIITAAPAPRYWFGTGAAVIATAAPAPQYPNRGGICRNWVGS